MGRTRVNGVQRRVSVPRVLGVIAVVAFTGGTGVAAGAAPLILRYTCSFPLIGDQPMTTTLVWNASDRHAVGQATPPLPVNASGTIGPFVTEALRLAGATTVEGAADATAVVGAPEGDIGVTTPLTVPSTAVPASGPMTFTAHGTAPSVVFNRPGDARITVGGLALHMTPRNANGDLTVLGVVQASCELDPGQNGVLASFRILPAAGSTTPPTGVPPQPTPAGPVAPGSPTDPSPSAGSDPGTSGTTSAAATAASSDDPVTRSSTASAGDIVETDGSSLLGLLLVAVGVPTAGAVACGCVWWLRRRRGDGPEVVRR